MGARQDDFIKGKHSHGSLGPNPGRMQLVSAALMLHSYQMEMSSMIFEMLQNYKYYLIFCNEHRNKEHLHYNFLKKIALSHFCIGSYPLL